MDTDTSLAEDMMSEDGEDGSSDVERGRSTSLDSPTQSEREPDSSSRRLASALCMGDMSTTSHSRTDTGTDNWLVAEESEVLTEEPSDHASVKQRRREQRRARALRLLRTGMGAFGLTDMETFWDSSYDTKALLGWSTDTVVLAFRGTASFTNACADIKVWRVPHAPLRGALLWGTRPMVHTGFYQLWTSNSFGRAVLEHLRRLVEEGLVRADARICVTGHSLGAALAMLAAHDIATQFPQCRIQAYFYGSPYVGNHAFSLDYQALIPDSWHVLEERDPIPRAGKFWFFFKRPGHRVLINQRGEVLVRPNALELQIKQPSRMSNHTSLSYRAAFLAVCLAQFSTCGVRGGSAGVLELAKSPFLRDELKQDGLDFHKLRRIARWGIVGSSRVAPPTPQQLRQMMAGGGRSRNKYSWKPRPAESPWAREPRLMLDTLQKYRDSLDEGAGAENAQGSER